MSEHINNVTRRKMILKNVLRQLHEGKTADEVSAEFGALAREASYGEIAEVEQMLIQEGLPVEEIQRLCDVHVAVFREGLDAAPTPENTPGHPVHTFMIENQALLSLLNEMDDTLKRVQAKSDQDALPALHEQFEKLQQIHRHYLRKEYLLFPHLERTGFSAPSKVMWGIHDDIRAKLKDLQEQLSGTLDAAAFYRVFDPVDTMLREMVYKEEKILFPAALERLDEQDWVSIRGQEHEFGYFLVLPGNIWHPQAASPVTAEKTDETFVIPEGALPLSTGALSLDQIDLMLRNLPVDITFVDEHDQVRYFSQSRERIFDRTPAIIGREVQNCHPPQSVDRVMRIIRDFRAGTRSLAEFWIEFGGKFIHIRYFALRDADDTYRGTLEVTQDVSGIRALQGERRLLND